VIRVLITGGNGFVGHHIIEHLLKNTNWRIITLDRLSYPSNNGYDKLRNIEVYDNIRVSKFQCDLRYPINDGVRLEIGHIDYILHVAADSHVDDSIKKPVTFVQNNINSILTILEYARKLKYLKKFLYFSTDEVFGTAPDKLNYKEGDRFNPSNPYSASKAAAECICMAYANTYKLPIVISNSMNILGERQHPDKFLPKIINSILDQDILFIHSNQDKTEAGQRHYIHARNVADAILFILTKTTELLSANDASQGKFNIVGEKEFDNLELAQFVAKYMELPLYYEMVDFHSSRPGHDLRYGLDGSKLREYGWKPPVDIASSIKRIVDWSLDNPKWLGR
jgi:dTDP-glucose 4,6-dehydratase